MSPRRPPSSFRRPEPASHPCRGAPESSEHRTRPLGPPRGLSFPFPLRLLHATLQPPHFVSGVQERLEVLAKAPPRRRHQNGLEKAPFQPLVPAPDSGREPAGGGPLGLGPRRQPAAGERRLLRRCWPLSVPSPGRCYLVSQTSPARLLPSSPLHTLPFRPPSGPRSPAPTAERTPSPALPGGAGR